MTTAARQAEPYTVEVYDNERDWRAARVKSIGSSEAAAVLGYSCWCGPLGLYVRKMEGRVEDDADNDPGEMAEWGHRHEDAIARKWAEVRSWPWESLNDPGAFTLFRSKDRPWITCTPDRLLYDFGTLIAELQLKTAYYKAFDVWKSRVPIAYQIQCQQSMYVLGTEVTYTAVLGNGYQFKHFMVQRSNRLEAMMQRLDDFWHNYVVAKVQPPADFSVSSADALRQLYPTHNGQCVELPEACDGFGDEYDKLLAARASANRRLSEIRNTVKQNMGNAQLARLVDGSGFRWDGPSGERRFTRKKQLGDPLQ